MRTYLTPEQYTNKMARKENYELINKLNMQLKARPVTMTAAEVTKTRRHLKAAEELQKTLNEQTTKCQISGQDLLNEIKAKLIIANQDIVASLNKERDEIAKSTNLTQYLHWNLDRIVELETKQRFYMTLNSQTAEAKTCEELLATYDRIIEFFERELKGLVRMSYSTSPASNIIDQFTAATLVKLTDTSWGNCRAIEFLKSMMQAYDVADDYGKTEWETTEWAHDNHYVICEN